MPTPTLTISITPTSVPQNTASIAITWDLEGYGSVTGGTLQAQLDGVDVGDAVDFGLDKTFSVTLPNTTSVGIHPVVVQFSGDSSRGVDPATSNTVPVTVTSSGDGGNPTPSLQNQAIVRPVCTSVAGPSLSRTQIENGEIQESVYQVVSIRIAAAGSEYDSFSVATLSGTVAGTETREELTLELDSNGAVTGATGFDATAQWDAPPKVTVTRWDGSGPSATFLGY